MGYQGLCRVYFVSETAQVKLKSGRSVSPCRQADDRFARRAHLEAVKLRQQLVQRLLALVVAHAAHLASAAARAVGSQVEIESTTRRQFIVQSAKFR